MKKYKRPKSSYASLLKLVRELFKENVALREEIQEIRNHFEKFGEYPS